MKRQAHEAELKKLAKAHWTGTQEAFEKAWPRLLEDALVKECQERDEQARAAMRACYSQNF